MSTVRSNSQVRQPAGRFRRELLPPARTFYERELGRLGKPSRGWVKANCCFHASKSKTSFSLNLQTGAWVCWGCDLRGDMVKFVRLRYGLTFPAAAEYLGAIDRDDSASHRAEVQFAQRRLEQQRAEQAAKQHEERCDRLNVRAALHAVAALYREAVRDHDWLLMSEFLPRLRDLESLYCQKSGLEDPYAI